MNNVEEEYEIQLFNFSLYQLKYETEILIDRRVKSLISDLIDDLKTKTAITAIEEGKQNTIENKILANIKCDMKKQIENLFKVYDNSFSIPPNVILPENKIHEKYKDNANFYQNKHLIDSLENKYKELVLLFSKLQQESIVIETIDDILNKEHEMLQKLDSIVRQAELNRDFKFEEELLKRVKMMKKM